MQLLVPVNSGEVSKPFLNPQMACNASLGEYANFGKAAVLRRP